jgi:hypothetical protein
MVRKAVRDFINKEINPNEDQSDRTVENDDFPVP